MKNLLSGLTLLAITLTANAIDLTQGTAFYQQKCASCHGSDGNTPSAAFPKLAGQNSAYLQKQLQDYQNGQRNSPIMTPIAKTLTPEEIQNLLAIIAGFTPTNGSAAPNLKQRGETLFRAGDRNKGISACAACHEPTGQGNNEMPTPSLASQNSGYIQQQLQAFQNQQRQNDYHQMMQMTAKVMSYEDMMAVASYANGLRNPQK